MVELTLRALMARAAWLHIIAVGALPLRDPCQRVADPLDSLYATELTASASSMRVGVGAVIGFERPRAHRAGCMAAHNRRRGDQWSPVVHTLQKAPLRRGAVAARRLRGSPAADFPIDNPTKQIYNTDAVSTRMQRPFLHI